MKADSANSSRMLITRSIVSMVLVFSVAIGTSACGTIPIFDKTVQDKAACDKLSDVLVAAGYTGGWTLFTFVPWLSNDPALGSFADSVESEVLPLSSMDFAPTLQTFVKYIRKVNSSSIFDRLASIEYGSETASEVLGHCLLMSREP